MEKHAFAVQVLCLLVIATPLVIGAVYMAITSPLLFLSGTLLASAGITAF